MTGAAFRIQRLEIEGFKAFAAPQSFEIGGGHVFVFGRNGLGKSSVVEAVRWCLFGLRDRPEAEVRNVFYPAGECRVELELDGPGGRWTMQRRLRPGSGRSDPTIRDPSGATVLQADVFPGLARLGPREAPTSSSPRSSRPAVARRRTSPTSTGYSTRTYGSTRCRTCSTA